MNINQLIENTELERLSCGLSSSELPLFMLSSEHAGSMIVRWFVVWLRLLQDAAERSHGWRKRSDRSTLLFIKDEHVTPNTDVFVTFVKQMLMPHLSSGDIVGNDAVGVGSHQHIGRNKPLQPHRVSDTL